MNCLRTFTVSAALGTLCVLTPAHAHAGSKFHIRNCSNHTVSVDIAMADFLQPSVRNLEHHSSVTMHCLFDTCNLGITWSGGRDDVNSFEHLYTDKRHGNYVLYMETGKSGDLFPSKYCIKSFALREGDSCDIFSDSFTEYDKLFSVFGDMKRCA